MMPSPMSVEAFNAAVDERMMFISRSKEFKGIIDGYFVEGLQQSEEFRAQLEARVVPVLSQMQAENKAEQAKMEGQMKTSLEKVDGAFAALSATVQLQVEAMSDLTGKLNTAYSELEKRIGHSSETIGQMRAAGDEAFEKLQELQGSSTAESARQTSEVEARLQQVQAAMAEAVANVATVREEAQERCNAIGRE